MSVPITGEIVILFLALIGAIGTLWWRIETRLSSQDRAREILSRELNEYKLYVAQNHVSAAALLMTENRLMQAIQKLEAHLDDAVRQLNALSRTSRP
jgi:hypothetical protein